MQEAALRSIFGPAPRVLCNQLRPSVLTHGSEVRLRMCVGWLVVTTFSHVTALRIFTKFGTKLDIDK